jgi:hypothetical protein
MHNLMPFIHLNNITNNVYDEDVHGAGEGLNLTITCELEVPWVNDTKHPERPSWPGRPRSRNTLIGEKKLSVSRHRSLDDLPGTSLRI